MEKKISWKVSVGSLSVCGALLYGMQVSHAEILFTDVSDSAGVGGDVYLGPSNHNLGLSWIDFDKDGFPDLFAVNGIDSDAHLFHNNGDGTFTKVDELLPVLPNVEMSGSIFADYDNDGDSDLYIQVSNEQFDLFGFMEPDGPPNMLLKNLWVENGHKIVTGEPLFVDVAAAAGVDGVLEIPLGDYPAKRSMTGGWLDYDRDGCVDLFVGEMVLQAGGESTNANTLYKNNCDGTFSDASAGSGMDDGTNTTNWRPTLAFSGGDLTDDGWPDMFVVNVHEPSPFFEDMFFQNNGDGTFTDNTALSPGVGDDAGSGMGIATADIDLDGDWDIYITDVFTTENDALPLGNVLYLGNGDGTWSDNIAPEAGVAGAFSWGAAFFDADHDGDEELYVAASDRDFLYLNNRDGTFDNISTAAGISMDGNGRGAVTADYDRDGDVDIAVVDQQGTLHLLRNDTTPSANWLQVNLMAVKSNRDAIGATVKVTAGGLNMSRQVIGGSSAHSQNELTLHFGLGVATKVDELTVIWPSGSVETFTGIAANGMITIVEGVDSDGDTIVDTADNCANISNIDQADADADGMGDVCDVEVVLPLAVDSVSPTSITVGERVAFTITGQGFAPDTVVEITTPGGVRINDVEFVDSTTLIVTIRVEANASPGWRRMQFTNMDETVTVARAFEVL